MKLAYHIICRFMRIRILQDKNDFELSTLPALLPVLNTAAGETLLLLVKHAKLIINKVTEIALKNFC